MGLINYLIYPIRDKWRSIIRVPKDRYDRSRLKNDNCTIFSNNCTGGVIYHNLGLQFLSPTINLYMEPKDYITFLENPKHFCNSVIMTEEKTARSYPVGNLDGLKIYGVHYDSFKQLKEKWEKRSKRINWENIIVFFIERDGCTHDDLVRFDKLNYNKIVFTKEEYFDIDSSYIIPNSYDEINKCVNNIVGYQSNTSLYRTIDAFDYVNFINGNGKKLESYRFF